MLMLIIVFFFFFRLRFAERSEQEDSDVSGEFLLLFVSGQGALGDQLELI